MVLYKQMKTVAIDTEKLPIHSDPDILGGTTVFVGTRVPVRSLFEYLEDGCSLDEFLENFPTVCKSDAIAVLEAAGSTVLQAVLA